MFSDIFMLFVLIVIMLAVSAMLWAVVVTYGMGVRGDRDVILRVGELPVKNDGTLLAFLETTHNGIPMKDLITLAVLEGSDIDDFFELKEISNSVLDQVFVDYYTSNQKSPKKYLLHLTNPDIILASNGEIITDDKVTVKIIGISKSSSLELYVG